MSTPVKWISLAKVVQQLSKMGSGTWTRNWDLKYIDIRIDTRDMHCLVSGGRSGKALTMEEIQTVIEQYDLWIHSINETALPPREDPNQGPL